MRFWKSRTNIPSAAKIGISLVTYNQTDCLAALVYALKAQTFRNFKVYIIHDGPWLPEAHRVCLVAIDGDDRFSMSCTEERANAYGHNLRQIGFDKAYAAGCDWIGTMNGDGLYAPVYFEWMLSEAETAKANFVCCNMIHSHKQWHAFVTGLVRAQIDAGSWLARSSIASLSKWTSLAFEGDWVYIHGLTQAPGFVPAKVNGFLFVHS